MLRRVGTVVGRLGWLGWLSEVGVSPTHTHTLIHTPEVLFQRWVRWVTPAVKADTHTHIFRPSRVGGMGGVGCVEWVA